MYVEKLRSIITQRVVYSHTNMKKGRIVGPCGRGARGEVFLFNFNKHKTFFLKLPVEYMIFYLRMSRAYDYLR